MQVKKKSKAQENKVAKDIGGKTILASGALWFAKGDVRSKHFLIECKTTEKNFYPLSARTWEKIYLEATKDGLRIPVMCVTLEKTQKNLAVLRSEDLRGMLNQEPTIHYQTEKGRSNCSVSVRVTKESCRFKLKNSRGTPFDLVTVLWEDFLSIANKYIESMGDEK